MTIAVDIKSGAVVGQVAEGLGRAGQEHVANGYVQLLTGAGYLTVPTSSVRIETV